MVLTCEVCTDILEKSSLLVCRKHNNNKRAAREYSRPGNVSRLQELNNFPI